MNSIHRIGVTIAALATAATIAAAFVIQGYVGAQQAVHATTQPPAGVTQVPPASLAPQVVYVNPVPTPQVLHVTQTQPPAQQAPVIHVVVPSVGGDDGGGSDDG